uniref:Uncharacterized protein n=1 Tax=Amphimedon queenslandica TaxID=400682 RepID=A0A1X7SDJ4_AMPQE
MNTKDGLSNARERKHAKENYISLLGDLNSRGYSTSFESIEIGSLGHFQPATVSSLHSILNHLHRRTISKLLLTLSKSAITSSQIIFNCRKSTEWSTSHPNAPQLS